MKEVFRLLYDLCSKQPSFLSKIVGCHCSATYLSDQEQWSASCGDEAKGLDPWFVMEGRACLVNDHAARAKTREKAGQERAPACLTSHRD